jgi:outer membrane protein assembly factor BamB
MKTLIAIAMVLVSASVLMSQEILWWYELKDSAFGQACGGDLDGDGKIEIVFGCYRNDSSVYVLNAEDGSLLWKFNTSDGRVEGCNDVAPLIYDVDGDGTKEVIVPSSCNPTTFCFNGVDGSLKWTAPTRGSDSPPTIGDIDGDNEFEILHGEFLGYVICFDAKTGNRKWELLVQPNTWIQTAPTLVDIDGDGLLDFVVATWCLSKSDTNRVYAFRGYDQKLLWRKDISATVYHGTSVADIDRDGKFELIFGDYDGVLYVLNAEDGSTKWTYSIPNWYYIGSPISIADVEGDGFCELLFSTAFHIVAMTKDGNILWSYQLNNESPSFRGVALSDLDNDNLPDVVFGTSKGKVIALKGTNGVNIATIDLQEHIGKEFSIDHCPLISDFNRDGKVDAFVVGGKTEYPNFTANYGRAYLVSLGYGNGPDWLVFQNNAHRTGSICDLLNSVPSFAFGYFRFNLRFDFNSGDIVIEYADLPSEQIEVSILDVFGRKVYSGNESEFSDGKFRFKLEKISSGIYFVSCKVGDIVNFKTISIVK